MEDSNPLDILKDVEKEVAYVDFGLLRKIILYKWQALTSSYSRYVSLVISIRSAKKTGRIKSSMLRAYADAKKNLVHDMSNVLLDVKPYFQSVFKKDSEAIEELKELELKLLSGKMSYKDFYKMMDYLRTVLFRTGFTKATVTKTEIEPEEKWFMESIE